MKILRGEVNIEDVLLIKRRTSESQSTALRLREAFRVMRGLRYEDFVSCISHRESCCESGVACFVISGEIRYPMVRPVTHLHRMKSNVGCRNVKLVFDIPAERKGKVTKCTQKINLCFTRANVEHIKSHTHVRCRDATFAMISHLVTWETSAYSFASAGTAIPSESCDSR